MNVSRGLTRSNLERNSDQQCLMKFWGDVIGIDIIITGEKILHEKDLIYVIDIYAFHG